MSATELGRPVPWARRARLVALALLFAAAGLRLWDPPLLELLRLRSFDLVQRLMPRETTNEVVVVAIDEASLRAHGQWPWSRAVVAAVLDRLADAGVAVVGIDVVFAEPDRGAATVAPGALAAASGAPRTSDLALARALRRLPVVLGEGGLVETVPSAAPAPPLADVGFLGRSGVDDLVTFRATVANLEVLRAEAAGAGIFSLATEQDGVVRRVPVVVGAGGVAMPALALEVVRVHEGAPAYLVAMDPGGVRHVRLGERVVPTDANGRFWPHYSRFDRARYVSAAALLAGEVHPERLAGRIALIGATATGLEDIRATPLGEAVPGVEVHAQLIESLMAGGALKRPGWFEVAELGVTLVVGALLVVLVPRAGARWTLAVLALALALVAAISLWAFAELRLLVDPLFPAATAIATFVLLSYLALNAEAAQRRQIRHAFARYLSPALVERLSRNPSGLRLGGETRDLTLMFADIRGFTSLSERYGDDPEGLTRLLNRFLTPMTDTILATDGTVDKYLGDGLMAFWNAPLDDAGHALRGCHAALAMRAALGRLNDEIAAEHGTARRERALAEARRTLVRADGGTAAADAFATVRELAESGAAEAQYFLAQSYRDGRGTPPDPAAAARWFAAAAAQGLGRAQRNLGLRYLAGDGVVADRETAYFWLALAADRGFETETVDLLELRNALDGDARRRADARLADWRPQQARGHVRLEMGLGLASGPCTVGNLGSERRFDYSALGDPVNLAARLESQTRRYGVDVIVADATVERAPALAFLEIDLVQVVGRRALTRIFALLGDEAHAASDGFRGQRAAHHAFLEAYRAQRWDEADARAADLTSAYPELRDLYSTYRARLVRYRAEPPPPDWDGAYRSATK